MKVIDHASRPHGGADEQHFELPALMQPLLGRADGLPVRVYRVTFGEGARTSWHRHDDVQVLYGLSGTCVVVDREGNEASQSESSIRRLLWCRTPYKFPRLSR